MKIDHDGERRLVRGIKAWPHYGEIFKAFADDFARFNEAESRVRGISVETRNGQVIATLPSGRRLSVWYEVRRGDQLADHRGVLVAAVLWDGQLPVKVGEIEFDQDGATKHPRAEGRGYLHLNQPADAWAIACSLADAALDAPRLVIANVPHPTPHAPTPAEP